MVVGSPKRSRRPAGGALGGDLADAVGAQERPHAVVVAQRPVLVEDAVALGLVDPGGRAVQEGAWRRGGAPSDILFNQEANSGSSPDQP